MGDSANTTGEQESSVNEIIKALLMGGMKVSKHSNELPRVTDWNYYQSFPPFSNTMKHFGERIVPMMTKIYQHYGLNPRLKQLDVDEQIELISDSNDVIMEKINTHLDDAAGIKKQAETVVLEMTKAAQVNGSWNRMQGSSSTTVRLLAAKNIARPQLKFKEKVNNKPGPFVPKIKEKPHSLKPLAILLEVNDAGEEEYSHPYEFELERFTVADKFLETKPNLGRFAGVESTTLVMVETEESLQLLLKDLAQQSEIAVDLEAHSYRSYQGITCLMQISTPTTDYIIDTIALWDSLHQMNEIFANGNILKVFHGAEQDIQWLQRDFGVYVVNMFDTYQAAKLLNFPRLSLAYLLHHYCQVIVNKGYQLADWRMRPLPAEMIHYAREDTHYLLYVYERLKQDLLAKSIGNNLVLSVWESSRQTCLKKFAMPSSGPDSHLDMYRKSRKIFNDRQMFALKELFQWRDQVARQEDESIGYVLPKNMLMQIAEVLPREMQGILACCNPIPTLVRQHLLYLHNVILKARELPLTSVPKEDAPSMVLKPLFAPLDQDTEDPLHCVHDMMHLQDTRDDLPTLLCDRLPVADDAGRVSVGVKVAPTISVLAGNVGHENKVNQCVAFTTPYARFMQAKLAARAQSELEKVDTQERLEKVRQHFLSSIPDAGAAQVLDKAVEAEEKARYTLATEIRRKELRKKTMKLKKKSPLAGIKKKLSRAEKLPKGQAAVSDISEATPSKKCKEGEVAAFDYSQVSFQAFTTKKPEGRVNKRSSGRGRNKPKMVRKSATKSLTYSTTNK